MTFWLNKDEQLLEGDSLLLEIGFEFEVDGLIINSFGSLVVKIEVDRLRGSTSFEFLEFNGTTNDLATF